MSDLISRQAAIDVMCELMHHWFGGDPKDEIREIKRELEKLPSAQSTMGQQNDGDTISRRMAIDAMANTLWHYPNECYRNLNEYEFAKSLAELGLKSVPSVQSAEAIPVAFLEEQAKWFESMDNAFAKIEANNIRVMIKKYRREKNERSD